MLGPPVEEALGIAVLVALEIGGVAPPIHDGLPQEARALHEEISNRFP